jgi:multimeric flavodoxin WrbA
MDDIMKKVLVISGSPKKGDSYQVVKLIEKKMHDLGDAEFEYLILRKYNIEYCRGCLVCMRKGEDHCPLKDDIRMIRDKMLNADGVIFTSPVYVHTVTASIKNLFDRMAYYLHRPCFHNKYALTVSTTELSGLKETLQYLAFPVKSMGFNLVGEIGVIATAFNEPGPYQNEIMAKIEKATKNLFQNMINQSPIVPRLSDIVFFNKLKTKITIHKDRFPADYQYWQNKGWLEADYFFPAKINSIQKIIGALPVKLIKRTLRKKLGVEVYKKFFAQYPESA